MKTSVLSVDAKKPDSAVIERAARVIRDSGLVVIPTETVYGLGANALDPTAVKKIFAAKNRPQDNPLIVHVADVSEVNCLVKRVSPTAKKLMEAFWPGPLSLVFPKSSLIPDATSAGLDTVVIRMPNHAVARALIKTAGVPLAAPSANRSGNPSPTDAKHALSDLDGKVELVLDAGPCAVGVESTVFDVATRTVLRPGGISVEQLEKVVGKVKLAGAHSAVRSPGMKYRHYAPKAKLIVVDGAPSATAKKIAELQAQFAREKKSVYVLSKEDLSARRLFAVLREQDKKGTSIILSPSVKPIGIGLAVRNRLHKAASEVVTLE